MDQGNKIITVKRFRKNNQIIMYYLQSRWKKENNKLVYYGLRSGKNLNKNVIRINKKQSDIISRLPGELGRRQLKIVNNLLKSGIITDTWPKHIPRSVSEAVFCTNCSANDFIIPGLEFSPDGLCPLCENAEKTRNLKSVVPIINNIPKSTKSRFDIAVFYTGGKDSTYLLYYLAKIKKLRVLALTWIIPYASESALKSIENAKKHLDNVEFVTRTVNSDDMRKIYRKLIELNGNTCACPSLAYVLFYPLLVEEHVPFFTAGNEPAQMAGLYFNHMAPKLAYRFPDNKLLNFLVNFGRIITLRPPLKRGQFHTLATMRQLAYGTNKFVKLSGYRNELVENVTQAIHTIPAIVKPLRKSLRRSSITGNIPSFVQIDFDSVSGGKYEWTKVKDIIINECGWVAPEDIGKGLHTSCKIEKCKEFTQFTAFYNMKSRMIPFSAIEISLASRDKNITREEAVYEIENTLGFSLKEIPECKIMREFIERK